MIFREEMKKCVKLKVTLRGRKLEAIPAKPRIRTEGLSQFINSDGYEKDAINYIKIQNLILFHSSDYTAF